MLLTITTGQLVLGRNGGQVQQPGAGMQAILPSMSGYFASNGLISTAAAQASGVLMITAADILFW